MKEKVQNQANPTHGMMGLEEPSSDLAEPLAKALFEQGFWYKDTVEVDLLKLVEGRVPHA